jgi:hypothetical protein
LFMDKTKTTTVVTMVLLMASITLMTMPVQLIQPAQAQIVGQSGFQGWHGTTNDDRVKYPSIPHLGPLPSGVTPQFTIASYGALSVTPNPVGVGQMLLVNVWTIPGMPPYFYMQGYTVYVKKPDGTTETIGPYDSYMADATAWFNYIPDQVGTYSFKFESAGTYIPPGIYASNPTGQALSAAGNYTLGASIYYTSFSTDWQDVTVQQDMVASYPPAPLPTDYWKRPIYPDNREWWPIAGNYPFTGAVYYPNGRVLYSSNYKYTAYVQAPNTCHVVWRIQGNLAGLLGGEEYQYSLSAGSGTPSIIYSGRCYQTVSKSIMQTINGTQQSWPTSVWECYDLRTGQVYWDITGVTAPTFISYEKSTSEAIPGSEASQGYSVYLVAVSGNRLIKYNPYTGAASVNVSIPVSSGTVTYGPYMLSLVNYPKPGYPQNYYLINWTVAGSSANFASRIISNITYGQMFPYTDANGVTINYNMTTIGTLDLDAGIAVFMWWANERFPSINPGSDAYCIGHFFQAVDLKTGKTLWIDENNGTTTESTYASGLTVMVYQGKVASANKARSWTCWDARTGRELWVSEKTAYPWGGWFPYNCASYDISESQSAIITSTYEGIYAIDWDNGHILWHYTDPNVIPFEQPYDAPPFNTAVTIADGKVYAYNGEHTPSQPLTRAWSTYCLNATNGQLIWKMGGPMAPGAVADGYLTASNAYDGYMYVFGKGKSAATVSAPDTAVTAGTTVLMHGTVMDMSPGEQGSFQNPTAPPDSLTKPGTVPCVSKDSMKTMMEYLYEQKPIDGIWHNETITGVPVTLTAIGLDGTVTDIGTTTTNGYYGNYGMAWTPPKADTYTIIATFAGDDSYGSSTAATSLVVVQAPASPTPTPTQGPTTQPDNTGLYMLVSGVGIAIIIAIAIVGILLYRKRP